MVGKILSECFFKKEQRGDEIFARPRRSVAKFGWLKRIQAGFSFLFFFPSASLSLTLIQISTLAPIGFSLLSLLSLLSSLFSPFVWLDFFPPKKISNTNKTSSSVSSSSSQRERKREQRKKKEAPAAATIGEDEGKRRGESVFRIARAFVVVVRCENVCVCAFCFFSKRYTCDDENNITKSKE